MQVRAIRGATTVKNNTSDEIIAETIFMLEQIVEKNQIKKADIISAVFTMTNDLDAIYPAVAARQLGWTEVALMCVNELSIPDSLGKCIRVMIHINTEKSNTDLYPVYLKGAVILRPDLQK